MLALTTERKHHVSNRTLDLLRGAGAAENRCRARRPLSSGSSAERASKPSPGISAFPHTGYPSGVVASASELSASSLSASVARGPALHARAEIGVIVRLWLPQSRAARGAAARADRARASASPHTRRRSRIASTRSATPRSRAPRPSPAVRGWLARTPSRTAPRYFPAPSLRLRRPQARPPPQRMSPALACGQQGLGMPGCAWLGQGRCRSADRSANQGRRGIAAIRRRPADLRCAQPRCGFLAPGRPALRNLARAWRGRG